jgi:hypothetical protein
MRRPDSGALLRLALVMACLLGLAGVSGLGLNAVPMSRVGPQEAHARPASAPVPAPMLTPGSRLAVVALNGRVYAMGGWGRDTLVEEYDPVANAWTTRAPMPRVRWSFGLAAATNGRIFATSGPDTFLDEFSPSGNVWAGKSPAPTLRDAPLAVGHPNGKVYVISGSGLTTNDQYDPSTDSWSGIAGMIVGRTAPAGAVGSDGRIYVFGGIAGTNLTAAEAYDPITNTWETLPPMLTARHAAAAVAFGSRILVFGGSAAINGGNDYTASTVVEYYDILPRQWGSLASMPTDRSDFGAAAIPDGRILMIGGYSGNGGPSDPIPGVVDAYCPFSDTWNAACVAPTPTPTVTSTPTPTSSPTLTPTVTATTTASPTPTATVATCAPRPPVTLQTSRPSFGRLAVSVIATTLPSTPTNWLRRIRFERLDNASVDVRGLAAQQQPFTVELPERPRQVDFSVTWVTQGAFAAHLVVTDDCGEWRTFVGAGAQAF